MPDPKFAFAWDNNTSNSTIAWLHVNVQLSDVTITEHSLDKSEDAMRGSGLLRAIYGIYGVQEAWVDRYKIRVERTKVIEWGPICRLIEEAVKSYCQDRSLAPPALSQEPAAQA